ncbi:MAG: hypothetical protein KAY65_06485 [Planctomycetes bacterium]|nr:hypothetical protein [Planctomycetota bacterium]
MEKLKAQLDKLTEQLENSEDFTASLENLVSVYPFNEYEYIISHLLAANKLSLDDYYQLRDSYTERNLYLYVFEISAPRRLGDKWAYGQIKQLVSGIKKPSKKLDPQYSNQYDLWLDWVDQKRKSHGICIEVKTSRAVDFEKPHEPLYIKALTSDSDRPFDMNFQQIKTRCADVFLWIGIWRDTIRYWVLSSDEVSSNRYFSKGQHRGNIGEGQLHIKDDNIDEFENYEVPTAKIGDAIIGAYKRQKKIK